MKFYTVVQTAIARGAWPDRLNLGPMSQREMTRAFIGHAHGWQDKEDADVLDFVGKLVELGLVTVDEIDLMGLVRVIAADVEALRIAGFAVSVVTVPTHYAIGMGFNSTTRKDDSYRSEAVVVWDEYAEGVELVVESIDTLPGCGYRLMVAGRS